MKNIVVKVHARFVEGYSVSGIDVYIPVCDTWLNFSGNWELGLINSYESKECKVHDMQDLLKEEDLYKLKAEIFDYFYEEVNY